MLRFRTTITLLIITLSSNAQIIINSLNDAINIALQNNYELKISKQKKDIAVLDSRIVGASLYPTINGVTELNNNFALPTQLIPAKTFGGKEGEYKPLKFGTDYSINAYTEANVPLLNLSIWENIKLSKSQIEQSQTRYSQKELELKKAVAIAYYNYLLSLSIEKISADNMYAADTILLATQTKFKNDLVDKMEMNRLENTFLQSKSTYQNSVVQSKLRHNDLTYVLGIPQTQKVEINEQLESAKTISDFDISPLDYKTNYDFKMKAIELRNYGFSLQKEKARCYPELSAFARYGNQSFSNSISSFSDKENWYKNGLVGVRLNVPIFKGMSRNYEIKRAGKLSEIAKQEESYLISKIQKEDIELIENYHLSQIQLQLNMKAYEIVTENLKIIMNKYKVGVLPIDVFMNMYRETLITQQEYTRCLYNYFVCKATIQLRAESKN